MHQLQAWANRGAFKFPEGDDKGGFTMIKEDSNDNRVGMFSLTPEQNFGIQCVLDGTIQVWRPVEHYPLKEDATVLVRINPELKDGNASGYAVCRYETEYPLSGGEYHDLLIERPLIGDDMFDVLCDAKNYEGEEIDPCKFKLELSDITHWMPLYRLAQPPQEVSHA
jgi:hypothetical protein